MVSVLHYHHLFFINYVHYVHSAQFFTIASRFWRLVNQDQRQNSPIKASEVEGASYFSFLLCPVDFLLSARRNVVKSSDMEVKANTTTHWSPVVLHV